MTARTATWGVLVAAAVLGAGAIARPRPIRALSVTAPPAGPGPCGTGVTRRHRTVVLASVAGLLLAPPLALLPPVVTWARRRATSLRRARAQHRQVAGSLPDLVDLLLLCTAAGWSLPVAHARVGPRLPSPVGPALVAADAAAERGRPRAEALVDALSPLGDRSEGLAHVLADHLRYGVPLTPALERLGLELRLDRRRQAEIEARRVPVRLLGPLMLCILPAFALLTVVPLLAASLQALPT